ncbi:chaperonin 10-like protein [Chaetomium fimeti]|uniref:Chaperonin 10-like protein n=1 Tax=Chaetomium fimeti TaxID=1854472 RepID=A0AAE0HM62_9PEZI|nr:chaperonin 10-like protein [Chaetomium fimeti]
MPPQNQAAWLTAAKAKPLRVGPAPYPTPGPGQIVIRNGAVAINPVDWQKQLLGDVLLSHINYPFIQGGDAAGTVVEVGPGVSGASPRFRVGDRVVGVALSILESVNDAAEGAFQLYPVLRDHMAAPLPRALPFEQACVLPLALTTAAYGLFHEEFLGLDMPTVPARRAVGPGGKPRAVIVTGGATSVGSNGVQLAVAAGYEVISTASPKNFDYVKKLGARHVFDYQGDAPTLVAGIVAALEGRSLAGALATGEGAVEMCAAVMERHADTTHRFIASANPPPAGVSGAQARFIDSRDACEPDGRVARVWMDFMPRALEEGQFVAAPGPLVVGKGLEKIQEAMDLHMQGVSAQKVVVSLD